MSPEREPMANDSNSRTAEELEQQTVDVYVERALHGPVFRMKTQPEHPANIDALIENFDRALSHPDEDDLERLRKIVLDRQ